MEVMIEAAEKLVKYVSKETNILKLLEEFGEFQEVIVKYLTKGEGYKPKIEKIIEEGGDVVFRLLVVAQMLDISEEIIERAEAKAKMMLDWAVNKFEKQV